MLEEITQRMADLEERVAKLERERDTLQEQIENLAGGMRYMQRPKEF